MVNHVPSRSQYSAKRSQKALSSGFFALAADQQQAWACLKESSSLDIGPNQ
jgi:hypothetical protein